MEGRFFYNVFNAETQSAQRVLELPSAGVSELESGDSNWESTTLAPACAARPKASVDIPSWRLALGHANKIATAVGPVPRIRGKSGTDAHLRD